jgi:hypothetical protein
MAGAAVAEPLHRYLTFNASRTPHRAPLWGQVE